MYSIPVYMPVVCAEAALRCEASPDSGRTELVPSVAGAGVGVDV